MIFAASFANPGVLWLGLFLVPVLVLFLLRKRRRPLTVGSVMLWQQVLRDDVARSPFRRPREWWSLLLLVLAVAAAVLGAAGLRIGREGAAHSATVVVWDHTASMAASNDRGESPHVEARTAILGLIDGLRKGERFVVVLSGSHPRRLGESRDDSAVLRRLVADLEPGTTGGALDEGLRFGLAEARASTVDGIGPARVLVFSDMAVDAVALARVEAQGTEVSFIRCGASGANRGITGVQSGSANGEGRLLVSVEANDLAEGPVLLELHRDGALIDAREVAPTAGSPVIASFGVALPPGREHAPFELRLDGSDRLALDDRVQFSLSARRPPRVVHLGAEDPFLDALAEVFPSMELVRRSIDDPDLLGEEIDLLVVTEEVPEGAVLPRARRRLFLGVPPPGRAFSGQSVEPRFLRADRGSPFLRHLGFEELTVREARRIEVDAEARVLVSTTAGPQLLEYRGVDDTTLVWCSRIEDSNLVLLPLFPLLIRNLLDASLDGLALDLQDSASPLRFRVGAQGSAGDLQVRVHRPVGPDIERRARGGDLVQFAELPALGYHRITTTGLEDDSVVERGLGVALLDDDETTCPVFEGQVQLAEGEPAALMLVAGLQPQRPVWPWLAGLASLLLAAEAWSWLTRKN
ncbi:MAG: VWA domain-containing protein [Planctomycetes bacterium]|nr:VWA domain-containing protein [Planctomycetota bacterium]